MPDQIFRLDPRQKIEAQLQGALKRIVQSYVMDEIRSRVISAVDREIGNSFRTLSQVLLAQRSNAASPPNEIQPYIGTGKWAKLDREYKAHKQRYVGHTRWFDYGFRGFPSRADRGDDPLTDEFKRVRASSVIRIAGKSHVVVRRDKSGFTIRMMPNIRFTTKDFEFQFADVLTDDALAKLQNREYAYRAVVGPWFAHVMRDRIPSVVADAFRRKAK